MRKVITFCLIIISFLSLRFVSASELVTKDEALKAAFPAAEIFEKKEIAISANLKKEIEAKSGSKLVTLPHNAYPYFAAISKNETLGFAFEDIVRGKWGPIHYLVAVDPGGKVLNVIVLEYQERRGKPIAKKNFLSQFIGKTINDAFKLRKDVNGVTGATISSRAITDGVKKLLYLFHEIRGI